MKRTGVVVGLMVCAVASVAFASRLWSWVLDFDPGFAFTHQPAPTGSPLSSSVTILLVDGLRLDASRRMPTLNTLRRQGADIEARVGTPSFSRPGRATVAVGAPPSIHGVTTNRQKRALAIDNLFRRVGAISGACRVAGSKIWSDLFGDDIAGCGEYRADEAKEGPGAFVRQVPSVRASQEAGVAFVLAKPAMLRIADIISTDFAAHEYGGVSAEYQAEVSRADQVLADLVSHLDLLKETLVVTADHGHRGAGGHGGQEPEVLAIPIVMVGAGIRAATTATASQADIAPTVAALLGAALPAGSSGRPIVSVLLAGDDKLLAMTSAEAAQKQGFSRAVAGRLGVRAGEEGSGGWAALVHTYRDVEMQKRTPIAIVLATLALIGTLAAIYYARPGAWALMTGLAVGVLAFVGPIRSLMPPMSFSAINYDEMLIPFFEQIIMLAAVNTLVAIGGALLAARFFRKSSPAGSSVALAAASGLVGSVVLGGATMAAWLHHGLLLPPTIPGPDRMVEAFALTLSVISVSLTSLLMAVILWWVGARRI